jgi:hypothetical protein
MLNEIFNTSSMQEVQSKSFSQYNDPKFIGNISTALSLFPHLNTTPNPTTSSRANSTYVNISLNGLSVVVAGFLPSQNRQLSKNNKNYQLLYPYGVLPDDGL